MTHLMVLEVAPLLTALLLAGRIGGSYAGEVGMMQASNQNRLLKTLGVSHVKWSLVPTVISAVILAPILTAVAAVCALFVGGFTFAQYELGTQVFFFFCDHFFACPQRGHPHSYTLSFLLFPSIQTYM